MTQDSVAQKVRATVAAQPPGALLTWQDFDVAPDQVGALTQALSRLYRQGGLRRLTKGLYYKPAQGLLGEVIPAYDEVLARLLRLYRRNISYITGVNVYNKMGLTTQISREFVIATDRPRQPLQLQGLSVRFTEAYFKDPVEDVSLVQILDALADIRRIPATSPSQAAQVLQGQLRRLTFNQRRELVKCARTYPPQTRALTGFLLARLGASDLAQELRSSLNPFSRYRIGLDDSSFPDKRAWYIQ
ncbi:MAG: hypothetical protein IGS03_01560 [Candidatus Sericytochromatia bacterium]|nr:hypothetical protein [Candidatus Sericytochromatia bacterium]